MQAACVLLLQHCLLHLQVHLLQAKEDLALLQRPAEADELFRPGANGARPGVLSGSLGLDVTGITFHTHPDKGTPERCQSILLCGDASFPTFQLPLPGKELFPPLDGRHQHRHHT
jgi:hypothetical protein